LKLPPTTIKNATNGAVDDATVQKWGRAFQLAQAYYFWVMDQNARDALTSGVLADEAATGNLFGTDLRDLDEAKKEEGVFVVNSPAQPLTQVVSIPTELHAAMRRQGLTPAPFGMAVRFMGPFNRLIRFPDGREKSLYSASPETVATVVIWGEHRQDPDLGGIWYEYGYYGCEGIVKSVCQL
jgi:hypothetical protein